MHLIWFLVVLFVLLYPAAFIAGLVRGKLGPRARPLAVYINIATYAALAIVVVPMMT
jgi:hypothetical protein